ncbi:MAG: hypothetical protein AAFR68_16620 [Pseudomonadota bacterium]
MTTITIIIYALGMIGHYELMRCVGPQADHSETAHRYSCVLCAAVWPVFCFCVVALFVWRHVMGLWEKLRGYDDGC